MEMYSRYSTIVTDIIKDSVPVFEKSSIDDSYGFERMDKFFDAVYSLLIWQRKFTRRWTPCVVRAGQQQAHQQVNKRSKTERSD
jgi:hypothetical protein